MGGMCIIQDVFAIVIILPEKPAKISLEYYYMDVVYNIATN